MISRSEYGLDIDRQPDKGRHILTAVRALDDILTRMQAHQLKKSAMLKRLGLADRFFRPPSGVTASGAAKLPGP